MRRLRSLALLAGLAGCHATDEVPTPPFAGAASALLLGVDGGEVTFVHAFERGAQDFPTFARAADLQLLLLRFDCGLEALDLEPGAQTLRRDRRPTLDLPPPSSISTLRLSEEVGGWQAADAMPPEAEEALFRLDVRDKNLCQQRTATYEIEDQQEFVTDSTDLVLPTFGLKMSEQTTLVAAVFSKDFAATTTTGHSAYRLEGNQVSIWPEVKALGLLYDGVRREDGDLWLVGAEHLYRGHPDRGFEVVTSTTFSPSPRRMVLTGGGEELYLAVESDLGGAGGSFSSRRWLLELTPTGWRRVLLTQSEAADTDRVDAVWTGPRAVSAVGFSRRGGELLQVQGDDLTMEEVPGPLRFVQEVPGLGVVVANGGGGVFYKDGAEWRQLRPGGRPRLIERIEPLGDGAYAYLGFSGAFGIGQHYPDLGDCGFTQVAGAFPLDVVTEGPDRWLGLLVPIVGERLRFARAHLEAGPRAICGD